MNVNHLNPKMIAILTPNHGVDMDATIQVGPKIAQHLNALSQLCSHIANSDNLQHQIEELKNLAATYVPINNMLERSPVAEDVVYRRDRQDPMNNSEILILGGAERYTMSALRTKAARESANLADMLSNDPVDYHSAADSVKQLANTVNTMVAALKELSRKSRISRADLDEQQVEHEALKAVGDLRGALIKYGRTGKKISDEVVNKIMHDILAKTRRTDMNSLMQAWKSSQGGLTPLQWAQQSTDIHDRNIRNTATTAAIDESLTALHVLEMYETMRVGMGDRSWVAISKRLRAEGYDLQLIEDVIDRAIILSQDV